LSEFNSGLNKDFSSSCFCIKDNLVAIGNRVGNFSLLDLRNTKNPIKVFDVQQGGIRDIKINQSNVIFTGEIKSIGRQKHWTFLQQEFQVFGKTLFWA
jgi:hypothetical protein